MDKKVEIERDEESLECCCSDPFMSLPAELRPKAAPKKSALRKVTCPACGQLYWTNRAVDLCLACEKGS